MTTNFQVPSRFPAFQGLSSTPWEPKFHVTSTIEETADHINAPHEDYPYRIPATEHALRELLADFPSAASIHEAFCNETLLRVHQTIFGDTPHGGQWRQVRVRVGLHIPPEPNMVPKLMDQLAETYQDQIVDNQRLAAWYEDLQIIHPFQDGNGRVGGVMLALASHRLAPAQGFLAPGQ